MAGTIYTYPGDNFDSLMNAVCSLWKKSSVTVDGYHIQDQEFSLLKQDVPCRVWPRGGKELDSEAAYGIANYVVFMRPQWVDTSDRPLDIHDWIQINEINGDELIVPPDETQTQAMLDIIDIKNPSLLNHHLECFVKLIEP